MNEIKFITLFILVVFTMFVLGIHIYFQTTYELKLLHALSVLCLDDDKYADYNFSNFQKLPKNSKIFREEDEKTNNYNDEHVYCDLTIMGVNKNENSKSVSN